MGIYPVSKSYSLPQSQSPQSPMKYFTESTSPFPVTRTKYSKQFSFARTTYSFFSQFALFPVHVKT